MTLRDSIKAKTWVYEIGFAREDGSKYTTGGTALASTSDEAIDKIEDAYRLAENAPKYIRVTSRNAEGGSITRTQHMDSQGYKAPVKALPAPKEKAPSFSLADVTGMLPVDEPYWEIEVLPWPCTYKANDDDDEEKET